MPSLRAARIRKLFPTRTNRPKQSLRDQEVRRHQSLGHCHIAVKKSYLEQQLRF